MRIFKGLENIHAVIDRHNNEWRRENGEPEVPEYTPNEAVRRNWEKTMHGGTGGKNPERFKEGLNKSKPETETSEDLQNEAPEVEIVEVIKQEGVQHSWLYNEVEKAVRAAVADDRKHTKVIAIFVPVIQNAKEFEEIPVDESVTLPPVEEEIPVEDDTMPFEIVVEEGSEPEEITEVTAEVEEIPEEIAEEIVEEVSEQIPDSPDEPEEPEENQDELSEVPQDLPDSSLEEQPEENSGTFDLIPESQEHPDEELAEAFNTMEEKLAETSEPEPAPAVEELTPVEEEITEETQEEQEPQDLPDDTPDETQGENTEDPFRNEEEFTADAELDAEFTAGENEQDNMADDLGGVSGLDGAEEIQETSVEEAEEIEENNDEISTGEPMTFDEFPVIKEDENENSNGNDDSPVEEFLEEVKPETDGVSGEEINKKTIEPNPLEPPSIDDFEDDEVFEEPLETMLDETPSDLADFNDGEFTDEIENKDIKIE